MTRFCTCFFHLAPPTLLYYSPSPPPPPSIPTQLRAVHYSTSTFHSIHRFLSIRLRLPPPPLLLFRPCNPESGEQANPPPTVVQRLEKGGGQFEGGGSPPVSRNFPCRPSLDFSQSAIGPFFSSLPYPFFTCGEGAAWSQIGQSCWCYGGTETSRPSLSLSIPFGVGSDVAT